MASCLEEKEGNEVGSWKRLTMTGGRSNVLHMYVRTYTIHGENWKL